MSISDFDIKSTPVILQKGKNQKYPLRPAAKTTIGVETKQARPGGPEPPRLGNTCEITVRFSEFTRFWQENPRTARFALQTEARYLLPKERVRNCLRVRISKDNPIDVLHVAATRSAHYSNLQTCGSVWNCPVCASKITQRRREELSQAIDIWTARGSRVVMATFTLQHVVTEPCANILTGIRKSFSKFWEDRAGKKIKDKYQILGRVRGLETTYGQNGWHVHFHVLFFIRGKLSLPLVENMREDCDRQWQRVLERHNRYADSQHGVDIKIAEREVADYVAKLGKDSMAEAAKKIKTWTEAHELALSPIKRASGGGFTPMQMLALSLCGDKESGLRYAEYAKVFKGFSQLHWSKGLRDMLGLKQEKSDKELADEQHEQATILAQLGREQWQKILSNGVRGELLKVAATGDPWQVLEFLEDFGIDDAYLPDLVNDPNYHGRWRADYAGVGLPVDKDGDLIE